MGITRTTRREAVAQLAAARPSLADRAVAAIAKMAEGDALPPVHPGEILLEDYLKPLGLSPISAAKRLGVPRTRIERLVTGQTALTPDTALRLEKLLGTPAVFWLGLQADHDLAEARAHVAPDVAAIERVPQPA